MMINFTLFHRSLAELSTFRKNLAICYLGGHIIFLLFFCGIKLQYQIFKQARGIFLSQHEMIQLIFHIGNMPKMYKTVHLFRM